ncbi:PREDICTED: 14 kDa phosphohistidine phosphatase-like [Acropora digitifera]|uniref:14 kDa phosphohistidine phosphatase-like n=1 Tax=Acropora digitifera TaxID=70779 RepID=UPI00077A1427|nr:PREDICTED: 14 kDa phosphohistidine phosphatase-like [Acropora digitifera]
MEEGTSPKLSNISDVEIDENGRFKYILIKVIDDTQGNVYKYIVRGFAWATYHADIYDRIEEEMKRMGLKSDCVGGGRIEHDKSESKILVYGYSMGYGRADHSITVEKLKKTYPDYTSITFSNEGY